MTGRTHDLAALSLLGIIVITTVPEPMTLSTALLALLANQIGGITPDIDQPTAPFWRNLPIGGFFGRIIQKMLGGHRFLTHSILGVVIICVLAHWLLVFIQPLMPHVDRTIVLAAFAIGMVSHLIMDTFTKEGVPWLLPIPFKFGIPPVRSLRITTDSFTEKGIIFPGLIIFNIWLYAANYTHLVSLFQTGIKP